ncbi:hypothetical protein BK025_17780 [Sodalis sp. TME1]|nr:hypothetical protein BK025_17780 [Sodalis sp. TME1]
MAGGLSARPCYQWHWPVGSAPGPVTHGIGRWAQRPALLPMALTGGLSARLYYPRPCPLGPATGINPITAAHTSVMAMLPFRAAEALCFLWRR